MLPPASFPIHDLAAIAVSERRRRTARRTCSVRVTYAVITRPEFAPLPATAQDISEGGIGMRICAPLGRGTLLAVKLCASCGRRFLTRQAQVRHVRPGPAGTWLVGLAFGRWLMRADLDLVLTPAGGAAPDSPD
jgi:c-di-GMP-binding flagellar brake protein YcgR